jgi:hypothetical protein
MLSPDNTLFRTWRDGQIGQPGTLADYATLIAALHAVYVIDFDPQVYQQMRSLFATLQENFSSKDDLYYDTSDQIANLVVRPRNLQDNATPSGNAMAAFSHWLFANYEHEPENFDRASRMVARVNNYLRDYPTSFGYWLQVPERLRQDSKQVALISPANLNSLKPFLTVYRERYRPYAIIAARIAEHSEEKALPGILNDQPVIDGKPTAYVCQGFICRAPVTDVELFKAQLSQ